MRPTALLLLVLAVGCGADELVTPDADPGDPIGTGGIEGFVLATSGAPVLASVTGPGAVAGATVSVVGTALTDDTDDLGHFRLRAVPPGSYRLSIELPDGGTDDVPITVFADAVVVVGDRAYPRADAIAAAEAQLDPALDLDAIFVYSPPTPLPDGVVVAPAMGDDDGVADPALALTVTGEQWFFYVDPTPERGFQHDVQYVLVDATTGDVTTLDRTSWPQVNGRHYYAPPDEAPPDTIHAPPAAAPAHVSTLALQAVVPSHVPGCAAPKLYVLAVAGADELPMNQDLDDLSALYQHGPFTGEVVYREYRAREGDLHPKDRVLEKFEEICAASTPCDTIFFYASAHGNRAGGTLQLDTDRKVNGKPVVYDTLGPMDLHLENCAACHSITMIDACYSGRWIPVLQPKLAPLYGHEAVIMASAPAMIEGVYFTWYNGGRETGGMFTQTFLAQFAGTLYSIPDTFFVVADRMLHDTDASVRRSVPQIWERPRAPGETCEQSGFSYVELTADITDGTHTIAAGAHVSLNLITNGTITGVDGGCDFTHLHGGSNVIIDGTGPYTDPDPTGCGFGRILTTP